MKSRAFFSFLIALCLIATKAGASDWQTDYEQALAAAYRLRFEPAMKNGKPVQFWRSVQIEFNLKR